MRTRPAPALSVPVRAALAGQLYYMMVPDIFYMPLQHIMYNILDNSPTKPDEPHGAPDVSITGL